MAILSLLDVAQRGLLAQEAALNVVGQNIANVNTPGYTRQNAELLSDPGLPSSSGVVIGSGVHVLRVNQVLDPLLERRLLGAQADSSQQATLHDRLTALAGALSDVEEPSLATAVNGFFDAADALGRNPGGLAERETLLGRATLLASELNRGSSVVASQQRDADDRLGSVVRQANDDLGRIADLNRTITAAELGGQRANELRDQRQGLLGDVAGLLGVTGVEQLDGTLSIAAANGAVLVQGGAVVHGVTVRAQGVGLDGSALHEPGLTDSTGAFLSVPGAFTRGEIAGLATIRDDKLVSASATLDTFASTLVTEVNRVQTNGGAGAVDLDGASTATAPLFSGTDASSIAVALTGSGAARRIGAALGTQPGDNRNALNLADLRNTTALPALGNTTFTNFLAQTTGRLGEDAAVAGDSAAGASALEKQIQNQRDSLSGVNLDEELTNLLRYQRAYQASAQVVSVANSVLDELLRLVP
jgi:flagellar hook-associated protein 1 FlgK